MRYGISAAALFIQDRQVLLVNHRAAAQYDFWLPPGGRLEGEEWKIHQHDTWGWKEYATNPLVI